ASAGRGRACEVSVGRTNGLRDGGDVMLDLRSIVPRLQPVGVGEVEPGGSSRSARRSISSRLPNDEINVHFRASQGTRKLGFFDVFPSPNKRLWFPKKGGFRPERPLISLRKLGRFFARF